MQYIDQPAPPLAAVRAGPAQEGAQDVFHAHAGYELDFQLTGACHLRLDGRSLTLNAGDMALLVPGCPHRFVTAGSGGPERIVLHFEAAFLPLPAAELTTGDGVCCLRAVGTGAQRHVRVLLERLLELTAEGKAGEAEARHLTAALLLYLRELHGASPVSARQDTPGTACQVAGYLNAHYAEKLTVADVAARFHRSPAHLGRVFRAATGQTMVQYLNGVRVQAAQALLDGDTAPRMAEIARRCGFGSHENFCRVFRAFTGQTPQQYRRAQKK